MFDDIKSYLYNYNNILFALIFGSFASERNNNLSDLDIGIFTKDQFDLISFGKIISDLEKISGLKVDLVELNNLFKKSPNFAYQIITNHKLIFNRDINEFIKFKRNTFLYYFDTQPLRDEVNKSLYNRLTEYKFGSINND